MLLLIKLNLITLFKIIIVLLFDLPIVFKPIDNGKIETGPSNIFVVWFWVFKHKQKLEIFFKWWLISDDKIDFTDFYKN